MQNRGIIKIDLRIVNKREIGHKIIIVGSVMYMFMYIIFNINLFINVGSYDLGPILRSRSCKNESIMVNISILITLVC